MWPRLSTLVPALGCFLTLRGIMPDTRDALFVLVAGAGFFIAMYQSVSVIAETLPLTRRAQPPGRQPSSLVFIAR